MQHSAFGLVTSPQFIPGAADSHSTTLCSRKNGKVVGFTPGASLDRIVKRSGSYTAISTIPIAPPGQPPNTALGYALPLPAGKSITTPASVFTGLRIT